MAEGVSAEQGKHDCIFCHVSSPARVFDGGDYVTSMAGGHAFNLSYTDDDGVKQLHLEKCAECHSGGVIEGIIANFDEEIEALKLALQEKGILTETGSINRNYVYSQKELAALWNYKMLEEDLSHGVHNPDYAEKMISSALTFLAN